MKKELTKKIIMIMMIVMLLVLATSQVFATGSPIQIPGLGTDANATTNTITNTAANTQTPVINTQTPTITTNTVTNTAGSTYTNNTNLPQTGDASDYAIFALIIVFGVFAVYTFKKVRDYNI